MELTYVKLEAARVLRYVQRPTVGYNNIEKFAILTKRLARSRSPIIIIAHCSRARPVQREEHAFLLACLCVGQEHALLYTSVSFSETVG